MGTLFVDNAGTLVETLHDNRLPPGEESTMVSFTAQGGGFVQTLSRSEFERHFRPADLPGFSPTAVCADWLPEDVSIPAYSNGQRWNGWAMPHFTMEAALQLLQHSPNVRYDEQRDAFVIAAFNEGEEDSVCPATLITVDGQQIKTYAIGAGEWCWDLARQEDVHQAAQVNAPRERR